MDVETTQGSVVQTTEDTQNTLTRVQHVVIVGVGFGGLQAAKELGRQSIIGEGGVDLTCLQTG